MLARTKLALITIALADAVSVDTTSPSSAVKGSSQDDVNNADQKFIAVFELTASGGTSPTLDATVETSWDGTTWHTVASMTQLTGAGTKKQMVDFNHCGPYLRATATPGGTAVPSYSGKVLVASSGSIA